MDAISEFPATAYAALNNAENVHVHAADIGAGGDLTDILFNTVSPENCPTDDGGKCTGHPALQEVEVRRALAMAIDKQNIIDVALVGLGSPGVGFVALAWATTSSAPTRTFHLTLTARTP